MATKELQAIVRAGEQARDLGRTAALITVFKTSGSTYRRPGARMLVLAETDQPADSIGAAGLGSISGGCLEDDARERALETIRTGRAVSVCYDTTAEADTLLGSGLGCRGVVHVLIQPLTPTASAGPLGYLACALRERRAGAVITVCALDGSTSVELGQFLWLDEAGNLAGTLTDPALIAAVSNDARTVLEQGRSALHAYHDLEGRRVEIFIDAVYPPRSLLICGAGEDAVPLARLGKELGWCVRVVDGRRAYATRERFPEVDELVVCPPQKFATRLPVRQGEAVVLMTHNYSHDLEFLRTALASSAAYIGVLGPRGRTERLLSDLAEWQGSRCPTRVHGPAGLDIGAEAPEEIALAIVAEIQAVAAHRQGGSLKLRNAPLHGDPGNLSRFLPSGVPALAGSIRFSGAER